MPSSQSKAVTSLGNYVRTRYPDLSAVFETCDLWNVLTTSMKNPRGLTLIIPTDAEIKKLTTSLKSDDLLGDTCNYILAHILRAAYKTTSDWTSSIPIDMRIPAQRIHADISGQHVEFKNAEGKKYATIERDKNFNLAFRDNLAVWVVTDGSMRAAMDMPASKTEMQEVYRSRRTKTDEQSGNDKKTNKGKTGGYIVLKQHMQSARFQVAITAENDFAICARMQQKPNNSSFISYVMSFARYLHKTNADMFFQCVLPLIRFRHTDFYAIFEPHCEFNSDNEYLIPDHIINEWWQQYNAAEGYIDNVIEFRKYIDAMLAEAANSTNACAIYTASVELIKAIDNIRIEISEHAASDALLSQALYILREKYENIARSNTIGDIANVFPSELARHYQMHPFLKLTQDEIAYTCDPLFMLNWSAFDEQTYATLINMIGTSYHTSEPEVLEILPLTGVRRFNLMILAQNRAYSDEIRAFINSTHLLWIPISSALASNYPIRSSPEHPKDAAHLEVLYNTDAALILQHQRMYANMSRNDSDMVSAALGHMGASNITPQLREQIMRLAGDLQNK